jgi:flagellar basal-body rod protein FlgC
MSDFFAGMTTAASGMRVQSERQRVIAENIANADNIPLTPGGTPYTRKMVLFKNEMDKTSGAEVVKIEQIRKDTKTPYTQKYMPGHPGADASGYVMTPNVNSLVEMTDSREASRSYEANMMMFTQSRDMGQRLIDVLR